MFRKNIISISLLSVFFLISSCSILDSARKSLLGDDTKKKNSKQAKWVSKAQYVDLMEKYTNVNERYERLKDEQVHKQNKFSQIDELSASSPNSQVETVDAFGSQGVANEAAPAAASNSSKDLEFYRKAVALRDNGKVEEAIKIFQYLEGSSIKQIKVRAKKHIGDIYFAKGQFDLALQVYETIIRQNAFSGMVIKALENAVVCGNKLGLMDKKERYESMLRDFFEVRV